MANRDNQSELVCVQQTIALVQASEDADYFVYGAEIDTLGGDLVSVDVEPSRAITATDDIRFTVQDAETSGGTFATVDDDQLLPTYRSATEFKVFEPTSPYTQRWGVNGTRRFIKIGFNGVVIDTSNVSLVCNVTFKPREVPAYMLDDPAAPESPSTLP